MNTKEFITDILTLRYHPTKTLLIPPLTASDFASEYIQYGTAESNIDMVDKLIKRNITDTIKGDVISMALSGGIDSALVLAKIREVLPNLKIHCITVGFHENDTDLIAAKEIANKFDCVFHSIMIKNPLRTLPKQISISGEPRWNTFWYYVVREASKYSDMLVSGDGGDEVFAGYIFRYKHYMETLDKKDTWMQKASKYMSCHNRDWVDDQDKMFTPLMNFKWQDVYQKLRTYFDNSLNPLNQVLLADFNGKLMFDWLPANTKLHTYFDVKGYCPLLDTELVKFASTIPNHQKYNRYSNEGKLPLRQLLQRSGDDHLLVKEKKGYAPDMKMLWDNYGKDICETYLPKGDAVKYKIISEKWIESAFTHADMGNLRYISKLLSILSLDIWCQLYISYTMNPNHLL